MRFLAFILLAGIHTSLLAQENGNPKKAQMGSVVGNILDNLSGKALPFANVVLTDMNTAVKRSIVADKNGGFEFDRTPFGFYRLTVDVVGFAKTNIDSIRVHADRPDVNLNDVRLNAAGTSLDEVIVYAEKPLIENKDGKLTYNVAESPLSSGSNASEMLKNLPLMNANPDGTLLLRGKEPLILMDEKPVNLSGQQLSDLLESLPANVVEKVEVMLNPPPEYATYPGGVINIITKKGRVGVYKKINFSAGSRKEIAVSGNFNYRSSKLNISSSAGYGAVEVRGNSYSHRQNIYKDSVNYFYSESAFTNRSKHPNARVQVDYDFTKKSSLSVVYQGNLNFFNNNSSALYTNRDSLLRVYKASSRANSYDGIGYSHGFNTSYQWKGKNPVEKLQAYAGLSFSKNDNDRDFYQQFLRADFLPTGLDSTQLQLTDNYITSFHTNVNYNKPLNDTGTTFLSVGSSYSSNTYHNILNTSFLRRIDRVFVGNDLLSNNFYFRQSIFTVRAALIIGMPRHIRLIVGAQAERTGAEFEFIKGNAPNANNAYWRILPSVTIRKEFDKQLNMSLVFRETIRRPGITELNPSIDYGDPYNIRFGNPYIQPSLTDNFDLNLSYVEKNFNINGSLGYNRIKNVFNSIRTLIDSGKTQTTYQNISDQEEYQASLWAGITLAKRLRISVSGGYNYNKYSEREKLLYRYVDRGTFYTTFNYSYAPDNLTNIEANNRYTSFAGPQGRSRSNINMSLSVQRKFFKRKMILTLSAIDPFGLQKFNGYTTGTNFNIESFSVQNTQNFRIAVSYQFSKVIVKSNLNSKDKKDALEKLKK
ncbi:outer membrane beta-barrel protein [Sediminibacterium roseum]|uniref:Outer membrane beta-barrel protein n=1 Tax=Sediminibacterium roseum TaxID=1978412 RepID=A0ABW9ZVA8_9BACT|nr:outer membrane beta-barrel family protein [Sediminibacterium roseum]NCI51074.1 outer membrane beta-barrel protein [Sediminibacterium roseum]